MAGAELRKLLLGVGEDISTLPHLLDLASGVVYERFMLLPDKPFLLLSVGLLTVDTLVSLAKGELIVLARDFGL